MLIVDAAGIAGATITVATITGAQETGAVADGGTITTIGATITGDIIIGDTIIGGMVGVGTTEPHIPDGSWISDEDLDLFEVLYQRHPKSWANSDWNKHACRYSHLVDPTLGLPA